MNRKWIVLVALAAFFASGMFAHAQISGNVEAAGQSVPEQIPYRGYLEKDGSPYNGPAWFEFKIYPKLTGGEALWTEPQDSVDVSQGNFGVALGEKIEFSPARATAPDGHPLFQYPELYLEVGVRFTNSGAY